MVKLSALNLFPVFSQDQPIDAIRRGRELAQIVEKLGYNRYWIAEHHNSPGVISTATSVLIQYVLDATENIRVGAGGVMLPNHTPLQVAETYGMLDVLHPGRVDLSLGRAPGTDTETAQLIYHGETSEEGFKDGIRALQRYFGPAESQESVIAVPAIDRQVPLYILGSTTTSAQIAADLGLPYAFAGHFSPNFLDKAIEIYREQFVPSEYLQEPYLILAMIGTAQETTEKAEEMKSIWDFHSIQIARGESGQIQTPDISFYNHLTTVEKFFLKTRGGINLYGNPEEVANVWKDINTKYHPDEVMIVSYSPEIEQLEESYRIIKEVITTHS